MLSDLEGACKESYQNERRVLYRELYQCQNLKHGTLLAQGTHSHQRNMFHRYSHQCGRICALGPVPQTHDFFIVAGNVSKSLNQQNCCRPGMYYGNLYLEGVNLGRSKE